jgi:hypothetical protein
MITQQLIPKDGKKNKKGRLPVKHGNTGSTRNNKGTEKTKMISNDPTTRGW